MNLTSLKIGYRRPPKESDSMAPHIAHLNYFIIIKKLDPDAGEYKANGVQLLALLSRAGRGGLQQSICRVPNWSRKIYQTLLNLFIRFLNCQLY
jgi:hypothetical protein